MNFFLFFKYKTYTSFEPHLLYKQEMLQWMLYFFLIFFLFFCFFVSVEHRSCKQSAFFFPVNTDKEKNKQNKRKPASPDDEKKSQLFWSGTEHGRGSDVWVWSTKKCSDDDF